MDGQLFVQEVMDYKGIEIFKFRNLDDWNQWLEKNWNKYPKGIWVKIAKKNSGITSASYQEIREGCLIYGWIDGLVNKLDEKEYLLRVTPRRPKGMWSKINIGLIEELIRLGKMKPSGIVEVEKAKADGRWAAAYESPKNMQVPDDFVDELKKFPEAYEYYKSLNRTNTYAIAFKLNTAKSNEMRKERFESLLQMMKTGKRLQ